MISDGETMMHAYENLRKTQLIQLHLLLEVDKICKKKNILSHTS